MFSSIKIDYSDYPKSLINGINEVYMGFFFNKISLYVVVFFNKIWLYSDILLNKTHKTSFKPLVLLQSHLLLC